jgi:hypothetical protein
MLHVELTDKCIMELYNCTQSYHDQNMIESFTWPQITLVSNLANNLISVTKAIVIVLPY